MNPEHHDTERGSFRHHGEEDYLDVDSRGSFHREPPVVPERVAVLKANYKQAWLYFLLGLCLLVAWGIPIRYAITRALAFRPVDPGVRQSETFVAIAYEGISENPEEVSPERFRRHIEVLKEAGYHAITLEEVRDFYRDGEPLPEKAVLLTFDHSRKSSYFVARKVLQRAGWHAVMFVWTKPILDEDPAALRWPYIRAMIRSGAWEAGAQSHRGFEQITGDSEGGRQNFLTSPRWLVERARYETPEEFKKRLEADHRFVYDHIEKETGVAPMAFAFPYGDFGQYDERAILTRRLNMDLAAQFYDMAFIHGNAALNTAYTDPYRLNRLLVDPEWTAEDLRRRLDEAWPKRKGVMGERTLSNRLAWQVDWGGFELEEGDLRLYAPENLSGAKAWLNGTDLYGDFQARFKLKVDQGQVGFYFRASKDGESHLYLGLGDQGEVWLRQKQTGMEPFTLGTSRYIREPDGSIDLRVYVRGNQFFASTGGEPVFTEIISTRGEPRPGMVGLSVWDPEDGVASFELKDLEIEPFHTRLITWAPLTGPASSTLAGWLGEHGYRYTHLSPPWLHLATQGRAEQPGWDAKWLGELADVYNMAFTPEVIVERIDSVDRMLAENLAERAKEAGADGVFCNLSRLSGTPPLARVTSWIQTMSEALRKEGIDLIVALPASLERENTATSLFQGLSNLMIATRRDSPMRDGGLQFRNDRLVSWDRENLEVTAYPLEHQLTPGDADSDTGEWNEEVHSRILWEQGLEAFQHGEFEKAIRLWSAWRDMEPHNEKPPRMIGDVYVRQNNYGRAIEMYQESLEQNPGQISLVVRTARLLEEFAGKEEEAMEMLNLYSRLFPANSEILLGQAAMLLRQGKTAEAEERIQNVVERYPDDLSALALLHKLLPGAEARVENLKNILAVGTQVGMHTHFANALEVYNLLVWPESWRLMDVVKERAAGEEEPYGAYGSLLPRRTVVREKFHTGRLSRHWKSDSASEEREEGTLFLSAGATSTEAALRLRRSETLQNGFIEAEIEEARGYFWLYARRSEGNMIRFGFEPSGKLFLQIWKDGEVVANLNREWGRPRDRVCLRLEVRGDAAFGYIDGKPAFGAPTLIPEGMKLGWWGMAPWAPQFGVAQVMVREVAGGPLAMNIGMFRSRGEAWTDAEMVEHVKPNTDRLSVVSPIWYFQDINGEIRAETDGEFPNLRLLTRYYKIRLLPVIRSVSARTLDVDRLIALARENKLEGFTLSFTRLPDEEWFQRVEAKLVGTGIHLLAMQVNETRGVAEFREMGSSSNLFAGAHDVKSLRLVDLSGNANSLVSAIEPPSPAEEAAEPEHAEDAPSSEPKGAAPTVEFEPERDKLILF